MDKPFPDRPDAGDGTTKGLWSNLEQAVEQEHKPTIDLWENLGERLDLSKKKPERIASVEVARH